MFSFDELIYMVYFARDGGTNILHTVISHCRRLTDKRTHSLIHGILFEILYSRNNNVSNTYF